MGASARHTFRLRRRNASTRVTQGQIAQDAGLARDDPVRIIIFITGPASGSSLGLGPPEIRGSLVKPGSPGSSFPLTQVVGLLFGTRLHPGLL